MTSRQILRTISLIFIVSIQLAVSSDDAIVIKASSEDIHRKSRSLSTTEPEHTSSSHKEECGQVKVSLQNNYHSYLADLRRGALGRREVQSGELPFVVALLMNYQGQLFYCGGSIIDNRHILTAASCLAFMDQFDVAQLRIHVGDHDIYDSKEVEHLELKAKQIAYHKDFDSKSMRNNIALIRLETVLNFTDTIQPICLSDGDTKYDDGTTLAVVVGWGQLLYDPMEKLHKLDTRIWSNKECSRKYMKKFLAEISEDMVCAGSPVEPAKNLCRGNGGAPLVVRRNGRYELVGVTSWGIGGENFPCVYERVDRFLYWINRNRGYIS